MTDPFFTPLKSHPSTWPAKVAQLRDDNIDLILQAMASNAQAAEAHEARLAAEAEAEALRAENTRLRDVLELYANRVEEYASDDWARSDHAYDWLHEDVGETARAALEAPTQIHSATSSAKSVPRRG